MYVLWESWVVHLLVLLWLNDVLSCFCLFVHMFVSISKKLINIYGEKTHSLTKESIDLQLG